MLGKATKNEVIAYFDEAYPPSLVDDTAFNEILDAVWVSAPKQCLEGDLGGSPKDAIELGCLSHTLPSAPSRRQKIPLDAGLQPIVKRLQNAFKRWFEIPTELLCIQNKTRYCDCLCRRGIRAFARLAQSAPPSGLFTLAEFKASIKVFHCSCQVLCSHLPSKDPSTNPHEPWDSLFARLRTER